MWHIESTRLSLWDQLACFYSLRTINHGGYNLDIHGGQLARLDVKPFNLQAATHFGRLRAELYRIGKPIAPYDMMIAAHANALGLVLATNNTKEFARARTADY